MDKAPEEALLLVVADVGELEDEVGRPVNVVGSVDEYNGLVVEVIGIGVGTTVEVPVLVVLVGNRVVWLPVLVGRERERLLLAVLQLRLSELDAVKIG